ncbi:MULTISPECIES: hypothetical protein [Bacillaceae]|uniref:hypothetical protein n=1 Tax=Bacillaceae TaxID=186817 RepID=UPI0012DEC3AA|nr:MULTISPECIES: hypothetical protein [Bacillaceae]
MLPFKMEKKEHRFIHSIKRLRKNESGMIYPHVLVLLFLMSAAAVTATDAAVTKMKTADQLTEYYEMRLVELMAVRFVLKNPDTASFTMKTNKGTTDVQLLDQSEIERSIRITTTRGKRQFYATFLYNKENNRLTKRIEHQ